MSKVVVLIILACFWAACWTFPSGAPPDTCASMTPGHGPGDTTTLGSSYTIAASAAQYSPGDKITITITGKGGAKFRGYLVEVRQGNTAVGTMAVIGGQTICSQAAATHTENADKSTVSIVWTAPATSAGDVQVRATIVQTQPVWTTVSGPTISAVVVTLPGGTTVTTTTTTTTTTTSTPLISMKPIVSSGCGSTKSCFKSSVGCDTNCEYIVSWEPVGDEVHFEMSGITSGYIAVGLSEDLKMGDDNVIVCTSSGLVSHRFQADKSGLSLIDPNNPHYALTATSAGSDGPGRVSCSFSRKKTFPGARKKRAINAAHVFDLANPYYLFLARGSVDSNGYLMQHTKIPVASTKKADFSSKNQLLAEGIDFPLPTADAGLTVDTAFLIRNSIFGFRSQITVFSPLIMKMLR